MSEDTVKFGAAYYPECFPKEQWKRDVELMAQAGFNVVRLAEFAWSSMEPAPGTFEFDWLDAFISLAGRSGIRSILGTPTEAAPPWFMAAHPDARIVGEQGLRHGPGSRRCLCANHPAFVRASDRIVLAMGRRFGRNPNVLGWQIDNEFGTHQSINCFCDRCLLAFRRHLAGKYGTVDRLNEAWYASFWSHRVRSFREVLLPVNTIMGPSPQQWLDWRKFGGECWARFGNRQVERLRPLTPGQRITHNCGWYMEQIDFYQTMEKMDFAGIDLYQREPGVNALINTLFASIKPAVKHWVMEMASGDAEPAFHRQTFFMNYLRGAEGCSMWHFRGHLGGLEMGGGCVGLYGRGGPGFDGIRQTGALLRRCGKELAKNRPVYDVALLHSFEDLLLGQRHPEKLGLPPWKTLDAAIPLLTALERRGVASTFRRPWLDLRDFPVVFAPLTFSVSEAVAENLKTYVRSGGILVGFDHLGIFDEFGKFSDTEPPRHLSDLFGLTVGQVANAPEGQSIAGVFVGTWGRGTFTCGRGCELLPAGARVLARFRSGALRGSAAATVHAFGKGSAYFLGMQNPDEASLSAIVERILRKTPLKWHAAHPENLMCIRGDRLTAYLNLHGTRSIEVRLPKPARELLSEQTTARMRLDPYGVALFRND